MAWWRGNYGRSEAEHEADAATQLAVLVQAATSSSRHVGLRPNASGGAQRHSPGALVETNVAREGEVGVGQDRRTAKGNRRRRRAGDTIAQFIVRGDASVGLSGEISTQMRDNHVADLGRGFPRNVGSLAPDRSIRTVDNGYETAPLLDQACLLLQRLHELEPALPIEILRNEGRLLALIKGEPGHPVKYYMNKSPLSYRGFFNTLSLLTAGGLVQETVNAADKRQKLLS